MEEKKTKKTSWYKIGIYGVLALTVLGIALLTQIYNLQLIPFSYFLVLCGLVLLVYFWIVKSQIFTRSKRWKKIIGRLLLIVFNIFLIITNIYIYSTGEFFAFIGSNNYREDQISFIVLQDSHLNSLEDIEEAIFHVASESLDITSAIDNVSSRLKVDVEAIKLANNNELVAALYQGEAKIIVFNESYRNLILEYYNNFNTETKVIYSYKGGKVITSSKQVDVTSEKFNLFIAGVDNEDSITSSGRSDVNIIMSIDPVLKTITMINIPRDTYLPLACKDDEMDKLTHAGIFGIDCSLKSIEQLFDIDLHYFVKLNFTSVVSIVDKLDGIEVYSESSFTSNDGFYYHEGLNSLKGAETLSFVRDRNNQIDGDLGRGQNQMKVITAVIKKTLSFKGFQNYLGLLETVESNVQTNLTSKEIKKVIQMQLKDNKNWIIESYSLEGEDGYNYAYALGQRAYVYLPDENSLAKIKEILANTKIME